MCGSGENWTSRGGRYTWSWPRPPRCHSSQRGQTSSVWGSARWSWPRRAMAVTRAKVKGRHLLVCCCALRSMSSPCEAHKMHDAFSLRSETGHGFKRNRGDSVHPSSLATVQGGCLNLISLFFTYSCIVQMKSEHQSEPESLGIHFRLLLYCTFWLEMGRKASGTISQEVPLTQQKLRDSGPVCLEFHTQERIWEGFMWPPDGLEGVWPWDCSQVWTVVLMCVRSTTLGASPHSSKSQFYHL